MKQNLNMEMSDEESVEEAMEVDFEDQENATNTSNTLSVTNVPSIVFDDGNIKDEFEKIFLAFDEGVSVAYLKSFRRVRVSFSSCQVATDAKLVLHRAKYRGHELGLYYVQLPAAAPSTSTMSQLQPPPLTKQFLISPPASPPVGWAQTHEAHPIINYDLLSAVASLDTTKPYELHPPDTECPSIVVHLCDDEDSGGTSEEPEKQFHPLRSLPRNVVQTRRPNEEN